MSLQDEQRRFVFEGSGLTIKKGSQRFISGPSGSGKTMLLELTGQIRPPDTGGIVEVVYDGRVINTARLWHSPEGRNRLSELRANVFGYVTQVGGLMPFLTARENIEVMGRLRHLRHTFDTDFLLGGLRLSEVAHLKPAALSIGQRQRVSIARALWSKPRILIADEPTAALDPETAVRTMKLLLHCCEEAQSAVLIASHDHALMDDFGIPRMGIETVTEEGGIRSRLLDEEFAT